VIRAFVTALALAVSLLPTLAIAQDATPVPGVEVTPLYAITFPAGSLPPGNLELSLRTATYGAGSSDSSYGDGLEPGFGVVLVTAGSWAIRAEGPLVVLRGPDGQAEEVPPGTEVTLQAGDVLVYPRFDVHRSRRAVGDEEARVLSVVVVGRAGRATGSATPAVGDITVFQASGLLTGSERAVAGLEGGPVTLTLKRVTIAPNTALPPLVDATYTVRFVEQGRATVGILDAGTATPSSIVSVTQYGSIHWVSPASGQALYLANETEDPLVLLEASLAPAPATATPVAGA
jgi:hypothetical protein